MIFWAKLLIMFATLTWWGKLMALAIGERVEPFHPIVATWCMAVIDLGFGVLLGFGGDNLWTGRRSRRLCLPDGNPT